MTATLEVEPEAGAPSGDAVLSYLAEMLAALGGLAAGTTGVPDAIRIDRIAVLERIKAAAAAAQAAEIVAFARSQVAVQQSAGVNYRRLGQGIAEQVGLATKSSGWHGARKLSFARDLITQLPETFGLLSSGEISQYVAQLVATETSHLDSDVRRSVDAQLADDLGDLGPKQAAGLTRRLAQAADPQGAVKRGPARPIGAASHVAAGARHDVLAHGPVATAVYGPHRKRWPDHLRRRPHRPSFHRLAGQAPPPPRRRYLS